MLCSRGDVGTLWTPGVPSCQARHTLAADAAQGAAHARAAPQQPPQHLMVSLQHVKCLPNKILTKVPRVGGRP